MVSRLTAAKPIPLKKLFFLLILTNSGLGTLFRLAAKKKYTAKKAKMTVATFNSTAITSGLLSKNREIYTAMVACNIIIVDTPILKMIPFVFPFSTLTFAAFIFSSPGGTVAIKAAENVAKKRMKR